MKIKLPIFSASTVLGILIELNCKINKVDRYITKKLVTCTKKAYRNALKYGCQSTGDVIDVELEITDVEISCRVTDYGKGFDFDAEKEWLIKHPDRHSNIGYLISEETGPDILSIYSRRGEGTEVYIGFSTKNGDLYPY